MRSFRGSNHDSHASVIRGPRRYDYLGELASPGKHAGSHRGPGRAEEARGPLILPEIGADQSDPANRTPDRCANESAADLLKSQLKEAMERIRGERAVSGL